jgi:hypothetical protein
MLNIYSDFKLSSTKLRQVNINMLLRVINIVSPTSSIIFNVILCVLILSVLYIKNKQNNKHKKSGIKPQNRLSAKIAVCETPNFAIFF